MHPATEYRLSFPCVAHCIVQHINQQKQKLRCITTIIKYNSLISIAQPDNIAVAEVCDATGAATCNKARHNKFPRPDKMKDILRFLKCIIN